MTSRTVIIAGILVPTDNFGDYEQLESQIIRHMRFTDQYSDDKNPKFLIVNKEYDSIDIENHPLYLVWKIIALNDKMLSVGELNKIIRLINIHDPQSVEMPPHYNNMLKSLVPDINKLQYGVYIDHYDQDRRYELFEI